MLLFGKPLSYRCLKASSHSYLNCHLLHEDCPSPVPELQSLTESYLHQLPTLNSLCPQHEAEALCAQSCTPAPSIGLPTVELCYPELNQDALYN